MKLSKGNRDLILHGSLVKAVFTIAIPVVVNSFLQTMYNLTDTYWLGSSVSITSPPSTSSAPCRIRSSTSAAASPSRAR